MPVIISRDVVREPLYAIVPFFNPWRWHSRVKHTERAIKHFHDSGATVILVEVGFNRREFVFQDSGIDGLSTNCPGILGNDNRFKHKYIQLRCMDELWLKENAINIGVQYLPHDWEQVCWLDSDVHFLRPNWVGEAIQKLQHGGSSDCAFLQMFSQARDLGPNYELMPEGYPHAAGMGFVHAWKKDVLIDPANAKSDLANIKADIAKLSQDVSQLEQDITPAYPPRVWPGLAWACTRAAWEAVGGLIDIAAWGGGDYHMAWALVEQPKRMMNQNLHTNYRTVINEWYSRCARHIRKNLLVMDGTICHHWHGRKTERGYGIKHSLLAKIQFDPLRQLKRNSQGLWQLHDDGTDAYCQMRDLLRRIAKERNEDSIDTWEPVYSQGH